MPNPWERYQQPKTGPWVKYSTAPAGPKAPSGYGTPGNAPALTFQPGGPNDPAQAARVAAAEAAARVGVTNPADIAKARALSAIALEQKRKEMLLAAGDDAPVSVDPNAPTGAAYLKTLPPATSATVKALLAGRMSFPAGAGMRSPYWQQMLAHVAQADPNFDAVNYNSRNATRREFTAGQSAKNIKALNTAIGHLGQLDSQIGGTASHGGFPFATSVNSVVNHFDRGSGDPGITNYEQTSGALASELTQVFRGSGGAEADVKRYLSELDPNASEAQKKASIKNIAGLLQSRLNAIGDQYKKGMGTTADPLVLLDDHAQHVMGNLGFGGNGGNGGPPTPSSGSGPAPTGTLATGATRTELDDKSLGMINNMIKQGMSGDQINAVFGYQAVHPDDVKNAQWALKNGGSFAATREVPNSLFHRAASSPVGVGALSAVDGAIGGLTDEMAALPASLATGQSYSDTLKTLNARKQAAFAQDPKSALAGGIVGNIAGMYTGGKLLQGGKLATAAGKWAPYIGSGAYGAVEGAGQNNDNRLEGAVVGGMAGMVGQGMGELAAVPAGALARTAPVRGAINAGRGMFAGKAPINPVSALSPAEGSAASMFQKVGPANITGQLNEASSLGLPMTIADTSPQASSLAGAAVRRSPVAAQHAEGVLLPRARGQIDRLGQAVNRDLGPVSNIPQASADLTAEAKAAAGPLYQKAYSNPGASSVQLDDLATRPSFKKGLRSAYDIALEKGDDPTALGFDLNGQGEVTLTRVPSFQTLDYVKQGLDATLEPHRNLVTGKLELNTTTNAINGTKNTLLSRMDAVNPDYAAARQAYAGPVQARDALARGQDAFSLSPDELGMQVAGQSPEHLAQMQAGYRSGLMGRANNVRDTQNPWEATLGSPNARARIDTLYPGNPGTDNLFRSREIEGQMARSTNDITGNSKTAQRGIADAAFDGSSLPGKLASGALAVKTGGLSSLAQSLAPDALAGAWKLGVGKKAIAKADDLAPMLLNPDAAASSQTVDDILRKMEERRRYVEMMRPTRAAGMFGGSMGRAAGSGY
jgi:hypothetical protein